MNRPSSGGSLGPFCRLGQHPGREVGSDGHIQTRIRVRGCLIGPSPIDDRAILGLTVTDGHDGRR